jgi:hypothetical protein
VLCSSLDPLSMWIKPGMLLRGISLLERIELLQCHSCLALLVSGSCTAVPVLGISFGSELELAQSLGPDLVQDHLCDHITDHYDCYCH